MKCKIDPIEANDLIRRFTNNKTRWTHFKSIYRHMTYGTIMRIDLALSELGIIKPSELSMISTEDLLKIKNVGRASVSAFVKALSLNKIHIRSNKTFSQSL